MKLPCIEGTMGDWNYYLFSILFQDADNIIKFAHDVNDKTDLDHLIQRELTNRSNEIKNYLINQPQRLFGSLICASFGESIKFQSGGSGFGHIELEKQSKVYVLDGQHRLAAIKEAVKDNAQKFIKDKVAVLLVQHNTDKLGYQRARRLFTTVNRYAKQTSKATNRVMDEDDGNSYILLALIRSYKFYANHVKFSRVNKKGESVLAQSEAMGTSDTKFLMSVSSFYEVIFNLIPSKHRALFEHKRRQRLPDILVLEDAYNNVDARLDEMAEIIDPWELLKSGTISNVIEYRGKFGGHPLLRPVCIIPFASAFNEARDNGISLDHIKSVVETYNRVDEKPWSNLLWNPVRARMNGGQEVKRLALGIWRVLLGVATPSEQKLIISEWRDKVDPQKLNPKLESPFLP